MVDVALHHGAANGNSLWEYDGWSQDDNGGIYFEKAGDTGWGQGFAFWKEEVREYLSATMDTWLGEYNCDGVRIDSAHSMPPDFVRRSRVASTVRRAVRCGGARTRGRARSGRARRGRVLAVQQLRQLRGDDQLLEGEHGAARGGGARAGGVRANHAFVKFPLGSHDTIGKRPGHTHDLGHWASRFGGRGEWRARASMRLWWGVAAAGVGIPMLFMGTETHQDGHWHVEEDRPWTGRSSREGARSGPRRAWRASRRRTRCERTTGRSRGAPRG